MKKDPVILSAKIISGIFNPLLTPTYGIAAALSWSVLQFVSLKIRVNVTMIVFLLTALIPFMLIYGLSALRLVKSPALAERTERTIPYAATLVLYIATAIYLFVARAPHWLCGFMVGGSCALAIVLIINRWWKISAHGTATGGLTALAISIALRPDTPHAATWLIFAAIIATGLTCTSRLILNCHTPRQVYAGVANGFMNVFLWSLI